MSPHLGTRKADWKGFSFPGAYHRHLYFCYVVKKHFDQEVPQAEGEQARFPGRAGNSSILPAPADGAIQTTPATW